MSIHTAILRSAGLLVPVTQRNEWFAEWHGELSYIEKARESGAFRFCVGAFWDAFWFRRHYGSRRLDSPVECLVLLGLVASVSLMFSGRELFSSPFRNARGLVTGQTDHPPHDAAFYRATAEPVREPQGYALMTIVHASGNLFDVLGVRAPHPGRAPILVLSNDVWRTLFNGDRHIVGKFLEIDGKKARVAAIILEDDWPLAGHIDAWLLENLLPAEPGTLVVARSAAVAGLHPPRPRVRDSFATFFMAILLAVLIVSTSKPLAWRTLGGMRQWAFLLSKVMLILPAVYCCNGLAFRLNMPFATIFALAVFPGTFVAFRWVLEDQRRRCPVCLHLLSNPVHFGKASQTFLDWYGTEMMCGRGHGVLRIPELTTGCFSTQQWVNLDELCSV